MPLPLTVSCFSKMQIGFTFWYWLTWVFPEKKAVKRVRVCSVTPTNFFLLEAMKLCSVTFSLTYLQVRW